MPFVRGEFLNFEQNNVQNNTVPHEEALPAETVNTCSKTFRMAVAYHYSIIDAPPCLEWYENEGAIATIRKAMFLPYTAGNRRKIERVLVECEYCYNNDTVYDGFSRAEKTKKGKDVKLDIQDRFICTLVADNIEKGLGLRKPLSFLNAHLVQQGL